MEQIIEQMKEQQKEIEASLRALHKIICEIEKSPETPDITKDTSLEDQMRHPATAYFAKKFNTYNKQFKALEACIKTLEATV